LVKNLKLTIKNSQIAQALNLGSLKSKFAKQQQEAPQAAGETKKPKEEVEDFGKELKDEAVHKKARSHSVFSKSELIAAELQASTASQDAHSSVQTNALIEKEEGTERYGGSSKEEGIPSSNPLAMQGMTPYMTQEAAREIAFPDEKLNKPKKGRGKLNPLEDFEDDTAPASKAASNPLLHFATPSTIPALTPQAVVEEQVQPTFSGTPDIKAKPAAPAPIEPPPPVAAKPKEPEIKKVYITPSSMASKAPAVFAATPEHLKLGPTGRHMRDLIPPPRPPKPAPVAEKAAPAGNEEGTSSTEANRSKVKPKVKPKEQLAPGKIFESTDEVRKGPKGVKVKEFRDVKPIKRQEPTRTFDARDKQGLRSSDGLAGNANALFFRSVNMDFAAEFITQ